MTHQEKWTQYHNTHTKTFVEYNYNNKLLHSNVSNSPHCRCHAIMPSYLPAGANVHPHQIVVFCRVHSCAQHSPRYTGRNCRHLLLHTAYWMQDCTTVQSHGWRHHKHLRYEGRIASRVTITLPNIFKSFSICTFVLLCMMTKMHTSELSEIRLYRQCNAFKPRSLMLRRRRRKFICHVNSRVPEEAYAHLAGHLKYVLYNIYNCL